MWKEHYNEEFPGIVDTYGYIHGTQQQREQQNTAAAKTVPKLRSTDELIAEAKKLLQKEPNTVPTPKPKPEPQPNINEIKRLSRLLQDYRYIK